MALPDNSKSSISGACFAFRAPLPDTDRVEKHSIVARKPHTQATYDAHASARKVGPQVGRTQHPRTADDARMASTSGSNDDDAAPQQQQPPPSTEPEPERPELRGLKYIEHAVVQLEADAERINGILVAEVMAAQRAMTARLLLARRAAEELVLRPEDPDDAAEDGAAAGNGAGGGGAGSGVRPHPEDDLAKRVIEAMLIGLKDRPMKDLYDNLTRALNGHFSIWGNIERLRRSVGAATTPAEASR
ncbi:hypothetical protein DL765_011497 [Monosporascus sp. GIB2]|nr:hypothetical protein DL765_011497 [Monosporascus sp. GIB2]